MKRRRGCIRRDLIRDSRHLNSLFRLLDTATFVACVPRLRCSSSAGCFSPTFLRRILDVKKKIRKKEGRKGERERSREEARVETSYRYESALPVVSSSSPFSHPRRAHSLAPPISRLSTSITSTKSTPTPLNRGC